MKTLIAIIAVLVMTFTMAAAEPFTQTLYFQWFHAESEYPNIASWTFYWADSEAGPWSVALNIDHPDNKPLTSALGNLTVTVPLGEKVRKYFRVTAWSRIDGSETPPSNIVFYDFYNPGEAPKAPSNLTIKAYVTTP